KQVNVLINITTSSKILTCCRLFMRQIIYMLVNIDSTQINLAQKMYLTRKDKSLYWPWIEW
ncbi:hypothetical protein EVU19_22815, partial [Salmonella enterica subsp. enterica serovar Enteritidis]|nr:hypothetical protein [Salmonella enterica]EBM4960642.1 hypothetical protein [Salmonella enterica]EBW8451367.1 hypothetical protein [Salmonella enterica subsp. enterica serovar Enteritidis]ECD1177904.1 hypothetical protein [Salmonella enterica subsp. enterica serovar Enteritidis]EGW0003386.1 hypothetical protein [Salmonella enterica]